MSVFKGSYKVTSRMGNRIIFGSNEYHSGIDIVAITDPSIYANCYGVVDATPYEANGFGYYVRIITRDNNRLYFAHMKKDSICVKKGDIVTPYTKLGEMGSTGRSTGNHTHIELRKGLSGKESLDVGTYLGVPNLEGAYDSTKEEYYNARKELQKMCGFEDKTMWYLDAYEYNKDLIIKLYNKMK